MIETRKMHNTEKNLKFNTLVFSCYILSFVDIINRSKFGVGVGAIKYSFFLALMLVLVYIFTRRNIVFEWKNLILTFSLIISVTFSTVNSSIVSWTADGNSLILCIILYYLMTLIKLSSYNMSKVLTFYSYITLGISSWIIYDFVNGIDLGWSSGASITIMGIVKDPNYLAAFLVPGFTFLFYSFLFSGKKHPLILFMTILIFCGIFFTGSRGAFVGMLLAIIIIISQIIFEGKISNKKILLFLTVILSILYVYKVLMNSRLAGRMLGAESYTGNIRWLIWGKALQAFWNHPIVGSGLQSGSTYSISSTRFVTHNCFVDILTGQGVLGIILFSIIFWRLLRVKKENIHFMLAMFVSFFAPLFFINGYEGITFWLPMILCYQISLYCKNNHCVNLLWRKWKLKV